MPLLRMPALGFPRHLESEVEVRLIAPAQLVPQVGLGEHQAFLLDRGGTAAAIGL